MPKAKGVNEKKEKGNAIKAANKSLKDAAAAREKEKQEAQEWRNGSNTRSASRAAEQAAKADEQARKKAEKAALLAEEEATIGSCASASQARKLGGAKGKKKPQDGLALLEAALVGDADKKAKEKKRVERLKREKEERERIEKTRKQEEVIPQDPLLANTNAMIGNSLYADGGTLNICLEKGDIQASGIDSALSAMSVSKGDDHPEKRMKALHKAFEERMMPEMRKEFPGLKRSQYQEKIFNLWRKSPENPINWPKSEN